MRRTRAASHPQAFSTGPCERAQACFSIVAGIFFFLVVIKFGNPVILDATIIPPKTLPEAIYDSWPLKWAYWLSVPVFAMGLLAICRRHFEPPRVGEAPDNPHNTTANSAPPANDPSDCNGAHSKVLLFLPLIWLAWQCLAATQTVSPVLTAVTLKHFTICVALFYVGCFALAGVGNPWPLWAGFGLALAWVIRLGFEQHFGGLEATRRMIYEMPNWRELGPVYLKRIASDRIFSTFMYPNALAGGILFLLPVSVVFVWVLTPKVGMKARRAFVGILGGCGLACLYWSGSKSGWLIALAMGLIVLLHSPMSAHWKRAVTCAIIVFGLVGFAARYAKFFEKGSTSVVARFDYWAAAFRTACDHPLFGTGPGTFSVAYRAIKKHDSEMAQLCHNDYLEQASDSGIVGFLTYLAMILGFLVFLYRWRIKNFKSDDPFSTIHLAVWLGVLGVFLQSLVEFHLYYPAFGWSTFFLLGWMFGLRQPSPSGRKRIPPPSVV